MNRKTVVIFIGLLGLSGLSGWLKASGSTLARPAATDNWDEDGGKGVFQPDYASIGRQIRISGTLPISQKRALGRSNTLTSAESYENEEIPEFPEIVAIGIIDGVPKVTLYSDDQSILSFRNGDVIENGWQIVEVGLSNVVAKFDGEQHSFPVLSYDPFDRGDEFDENEK